MVGKSPVAADEEQRRELVALSHSRDRGEADRARAILLTLSGWTSGQIAQAFGVREDTVRFWRSAFMTGGLEALKKSVAPGPAPVKAERAHWLTVEWLPNYAPELNDIEGLWRNLKRHHLAHQTFNGPNDLDRAIHEAVGKLNTERNRHPLANHRIAATKIAPSGGSLLCGRLSF